MADDIAIRVSGVSKAFKLPHEKQNSIKGLFVSMFRGKRTYERQQVLRDVSFEIKKGEFFGIVGRNGSGKSTLLKLLAGIYTPDKGHIQVNGKLTPFIELGVGFNPELTGRENVFLNGALLGFSRKEMESMYDEIVDFAELEKFMDQKLKNYSSGMQVRLAFSIAIRANTDILVLDEVLAVGDEAFQRKCFNHFAQLKIAKKTVILVTHSMDHVIRFCDKALLINKGRIEYLGDNKGATELYEKLNLEEVKQGPSKSPDILNRKGDLANSNGKVAVEVVPVDVDEQRTESYLGSDSIRLRVKITANTQLNDVFLGLSIHRHDGEAVYVGTTEKSGEKLPKRLMPNRTVCLYYELQNIFSEDTYFVNVSVKSNDRKTIYLEASDIARFQVQVSGIHRVTFRPNTTIKVMRLEN